MPQNLSSDEIERQQRRAVRYLRLVLGVAAIVLAPFAIVALSFAIRFVAPPLAIVVVPLLDVLLGLALLLWLLVGIVAGCVGLAYVVVEHPRGPAPVQSLAAHLAPLEDLRADAARHARRRIWLYVPLAIVLAGALCTFMMHSARKGSPVIAFPMIFLIFIALSWVIAVSGPDRRYAKRFKETLLPTLLGRHGRFQMYEETFPSLDRLVGVGILPRPDKVMARDAFAGAYRGHPVRVAEACLEGHSDDKPSLTVFHGLVIDVEFELPFPSTTVVSDNRLIKYGAGIVPSGMTRLDAHNPLPDWLYAVFAEDETATRRLLTPEVAERLMQVFGQAFRPPVMLAEARTLTIVVPRSYATDFFEPPRLSSRTAGQQLAGFQSDIDGVFHLLDAMIDLVEAHQPEVE